jgi:diguanylate cyclase (GGDEF)-like protein/PAS domain S-box-containing protein
MMPSPDEILQRKLQREISARQQAETLLEQKSLELFIEAQERQETLSRLKESEARYRLIVEMSPDAILVEIDSRIAFANSAATRLFAETGSQRLAGATLSQLGLANDIELLGEKSGERADTVATRLDGSVVDISLRCMPMTYDGRNATQIVMRDISERKRLEQQLAYQATHDALTGVSNRSALLLQLDELLVYARRYQVPCWVAFLDLDRFKQINDRFGHRAGDTLLAAITTRLRQLLRQDDIIGRYGGDEFILVLRGGADSILTPQLLERIMQVVCEPVEVDGHALQVTCSLGIAAFPDDGDSGRILLERADAAMYRAKESGRNLYQLYNGEIHARLLERAQIERHLIDALAREEFFLLYQPKVEVATGKVTGVEALLRWRHPELGVLTPDRFIPMAEETVLINTLGLWVLREACRQCAALHQQGLSELTVAVNLSARQLNGPELIRMVHEALQSSGLAPSSLELELTESLMMSNVEQTMTTLRTLHARGVKISVDDFGTGYSSFAYLNRFPLSCLKIDRQFVAGLGEPGAHEASVITRTLIQLSHSLNLTVVAEGVETREQLQVLRDQGCDQIQGWLHSKAMEPEELLISMRAYDPAAWLSTMR